MNGHVLCTRLCNQEKETVTFNVNPMYQIPQEMFADFYFNAPIEHFQSYGE